MTTTILFIGDPHFKTNNIREVDMFIERTMSLVKSQHPLDLVVIGGDLLDYHERLHTDCLNRAHDFVSMLSSIVHTVVLVGNHDMITNTQFLNSNHWMNAMKKWNNVTIVDTVIELDSPSGKHHFVFCPYVYPGRFKEALSSLSSLSNVDAIFCHQEFKGAKMGAIVSENGDEWPLDYPQIISGHIHSRQKPQDNIYYPGSSMQHAFGESEKNILPILTWDDSSSGGNYKINEIDLKLPRKRTIHIDTDDLADYDCKISGGDKIRLSVSGSFEKFKAFKKTAKYKKLIKNNDIKVVYRVPRQQQQEQLRQLEHDIGGSGDFKRIINDLMMKEDDSERLTALFREFVIDD